ncbi:MAG: PspA/IM30 family protein [Candidatus Poribacteria bacterium]|nr:PspA/IM30 family protein [Candidatus Poribacteria bacterium]
MANIFVRFWRYMTGWMHDGLSKAEAERPDIVYKQAIEDQTQRYQQMEEAVSGLVANRARLDEDLKKAENSLIEVRSTMEHAIINAQGSDKEAAEEAILVGSMLQEEEEKLVQRIYQLTESRDSVRAQVENYQEKLVEFRHSINQLQTERDEAVAQARVDKQTIELNRQLQGMSTESDMQSLNELRNNLGRLRAQATMSEEMQSESLDARVRKYKNAVRSDAAKAKFLQRVEESKALEAGTAGENESGSAGESASLSARERFLERVEGSSKDSEKGSDLPAKE